MIKPNFMEKLLDGVKVEWKTLGDIAELYGGLSGKNKEDFENGNALYISYKNIFDNIEVNFDKLESVKISTSENQHEVKYGDILFTGSSETIEEVGMSSAVITKFEDKVYLNSFSFGVRFNDDILIIPQFSKYLFRSHFMRDEITKTASGVTRFNISKTRFKKIPIPIPPLKIQNEIVRILDTFTQLTAELTAELTARKKQYEYYENQLLFNTSYKKIPMSQICTVNQGLQIPISQRMLEDGNNRYFYITIQFLKGGKDKYYIDNPPESVICDYDDILVTRTGSTGKIITGVKGCFHNNFFKINCFDEINKRYIYYVLNSKKMYEIMLNTASGGTIPDLPHTKFYKLEIHIPPLTEQKRIVSILDKFDDLTSSITKGLPCEIELRQKQYEYYRNMLLNFPKEV